MAKMKKSMARKDKNLEEVCSLYYESLDEITVILDKSSGYWQQKQEFSSVLRQKNKDLEEIVAK